MLFLTVTTLAGAEPSWTGSLSPPEAVEDEIAVHRAALAADPTDLEARWRLLRSLHYLSEFTTASAERRDAAVEEAVVNARIAVADLETQREARDPSEVARVYFWSAIAWGARAQRVGLLTIVREGVAGKMAEYASIAVDLDPTIERGGAYRLLSRLHADLPRVPFISGWVDRDQVVPLAEQAVAVAPEDPGNRLVLALALLDAAPDRRDEARDLLAEVAALRPRPELRAEDLAIAEQAASRLAELGPST